MEHMVLNKSQIQIYEHTFLREIERGAGGSVETVSTWSIMKTYFSLRYVCMYDHQTYVIVS